MGKKWLIVPLVMILLLAVGCEDPNQSDPVNSSPPAAPSGLTAVETSSSTIDLNWIDNSNDEKGFRIQRADSHDGDYQEIALLNNNVISYTNDALQPASTYWYRIQAYNDIGFSDYSNTANATTENLPDYTIQYKVTGTGPVTESAFIAYSDQNGDTQQIASTSLPWELIIESDERPRAYIVSTTGASSYLEPVSITAEVWKDGELVESNTADCYTISGFYLINGSATATTTVE